MRPWHALSFGGLMLVLWIPLLGIAFPALRSAEGRRELNVDLSKLSTLPHQLNQYVSGNLAFKDRALTLLGRFKLHVLGISPSDRVILGREGWLFLRDEGALDGHRGVRGFTAQELARWRQTLDSRHALSASVGAPYLFMIAPDKHTVVSEALPAFCAPAGANSRLDQLLGSGPTDPHVLVDCRGRIGASVGGLEVFHKTDTHWNAYGAFLAYQALAEALRARFPAVRPLAADQVRFTLRQTPGGDLARLLGMKHEFQEQSVVAEVLRAGDVSAKPEPLSSLWMGIEVRHRPGVVTSCESGEIERGVVLYDSFGEYLIPYLARHFKHARFIATSRFPWEMVRAEKPDVVIQELVERRLMTWVPQKATD